MTIQWLTWQWRDSGVACIIIIVHVHNSVNYTKFWYRATCKWNSSYIEVFYFMFPVKILFLFSVKRKGASVWSHNCHMCACMLLYVWSVVWLSVMQFVSLFFAERVVCNQHCPLRFCIIIRNIIYFIFVFWKLIWIRAFKCESFVCEWKCHLILLLYWCVGIQK